MRLPTKIRLLSVPRNRRHDLQYPTLEIKVVDTSGGEWTTASLAEAIVHLRSTVGARLIIEDRHYEWMGRSDTISPRQPVFDETSSLVIDRLDDDFTVVRLEAGPDDRTNDNLDAGQAQWVYDLTFDPPVREVGRTQVSTVEVEVDLPHRHGDRVLPPVPAR